MYYSLAVSIIIIRWVCGTEASKELGSGSSGIAPNTRRIRNIPSGLIVELIDITEIGN